MDEHRPERVEVDGFELPVDPVPDEGSANHTALPTKIETWRRRSAMGAILTGFALGLKEALEPKRDEPAIVAQVSGDPVGDQPIQAELDDLRPRESIVTIRPWLLADRPPEPVDDTEGDMGPTLPKP
ncbi:MAG TPA: hypothetical protein VGH66_15795 [Acidimicrobiales bacterium]